MTVVSSKIKTFIRISIWILLLAVTIITVLYWIYVRVPDPGGYYQHDPLNVGIETTVPTPKTQLILRKQVQAEARISAEA
jgi:hypothetical protein